MGLIKIEGMEFYAFHGHFPEERVVGNSFIIDLEIETDLSLPSKTDNLDDAVDYQKAYKIVASEMEEKSALLENIAGRILKSLSTELEGIIGVTVKVAKINPPLGGKVKSVSITESWHR